jgi:hypothetical protein
MKHNEFMWLEEKCPKCQSNLMLQKTSWSELSGDLHYVFCEPCKCKGNGANDKENALENFHKELARKEKLALRKPEKILTDIRDYLWAILDEWHKRIDEPNFYEQNIGVYNHVRKELDDLTEYADKLGVEL